MRERCRAALLRLLDQQKNRAQVIEEVDDEENPDDAYSTNSDADIFLDFEEALE